MSKKRCQMIINFSQRMRSFIFCPKKGGGKVGRRRDQHNQVLQSPISSPATFYNP